MRDAGRRLANGGYRGLRSRTASSRAAPSTHEARLVGAHCGPTSASAGVRRRFVGYATYVA